MKKDILIILVCLSVGLVITGCGMAGLIYEQSGMLEEDVFDITAVTLGSFLPGKEGRFEGVKLGMTTAEVREIIENSKSLTLVESDKEIDIVKTIMWGFETRINFHYYEGKLFKIVFGTETVSEDLIETDLREQLIKYYNHFCKEFGNPGFAKKDFSFGKLTITSFRETSPILLYAWIEGNVGMGLWLSQEDAKYCGFATIWDRKIMNKKESEEESEK